MNKSVFTHSVTNGFTRFATSKCEELQDFSELENEKIRRMKKRIPYFLERLNGYIPKEGNADTADDEVKEETGRFKTPLNTATNVKRTSDENIVLAHYPPKQEQYTKNIKGNDVEYEADLRQARLVLKDRQRKCLFNRPTMMIRPCPPLPTKPPTGSVGRTKLYAKRNSSELFPEKEFVFAEDKLHEKGRPADKTYEGKSFHKFNTDTEHYTKDKLLESCFFNGSFSYQQQLASKDSRTKVDRRRSTLNSIRSALVKNPLEIKDIPAKVERRPIDKIYVKRPSPASSSSSSFRCTATNIYQNKTSIKDPRNSTLDSRIKLGQSTHKSFQRNKNTTKSSQETPDKEFSKPVDYQAHIDEPTQDKTLKRNISFSKNLETFSIPGTSRQFDRKKSHPLTSPYPISALKNSATTKASIGKKDEGITNKTIDTQKSSSIVITAPSSESVFNSKE